MHGNGKFYFRVRFADFSRQLDVQHSPLNLYPIKKNPPDDNVLMGSFSENAIQTALQDALQKTGYASKIPVSLDMDSVHKNCVPVPGQEYIRHDTFWPGGSIQMLNSFFHRNIFHKYKIILTFPRIRWKS